MLVLAGPGSGKTSVLISHIQELTDIKKVPPQQILVVTFTRAAAMEMKERYAKLSRASASKVTFATLHSVFYAILRGAEKTKSRQLLAGKEKERILCGFLEPKEKNRELRQERARLLEKEIGYLKHHPDDKESFQPESMDKEDFLRTFSQYHDLLSAHGYWDFDDLVLETKRLLTENPEELARWRARFFYILVDEFQDMDPMQYEIVKLLAEGGRHLFMVGDDDQSIYGFRGSSPELMRRVTKDFPGLPLVYLDINYRCKAAIVAGSDRLIRHNKGRFKKKLRSFYEEKGQLLYREAKDKGKEYELLAGMIREEERKGRPLPEIAVLCRTREGVRTVAASLKGQGVSVEDAAGRGGLDKHFIWKDILAYIKLAGGNKERKYFLQIINKPMRYIDREMFMFPMVDLEKLLFLSEKNPLAQKGLKELAEELDALKGLSPAPFLYCLEHFAGYGNYLKDLARRQKKDPLEYRGIFSCLKKLAAGKENMEDFAAAVAGYSSGKEGEGVKVMTIHGAKGLEFSSVYIPDVNERNIPLKGREKEADIEEERRLFYVAMTRAKERLVILSVAENEAKIAGPSRFLAEAGIKKST